MGSQMIKWRGSVEGREVLGFMLEEKNLQRLREMKPIHIYREEMGLPFDIIIDYSDDLVKTVETMKKMGLISGKTIIHDERDRKKS